MQVDTILRQKGRGVVSVQPTLLVEELVRLLTARRIGAVLVQDSAGQLLGIVSERDIVGAIAGHGASALAMTTAQLMTTEVETATLTSTCAQAMTVMTNGRFRHLPVVEHGKVVGLVSIGDVVKARITEQAEEVDSLKAYVAGAV